MGLPGRALEASYAGIDCHWRSFLRDAHSDVAAIAAVLCFKMAASPRGRALEELGAALAAAEAGHLGFLGLFFMCCLYSVDVKNLRRELI
jgi:hypothetical protein